MKIKINPILVFSLLIILLQGCASTNPNKFLDEQQQDSTTVLTDKTNIQSKQLTIIKNYTADFAFASQHALESSADSTSKLKVIAQFNGRIQSLVGAPSIQDETLISNIVDGMLSTDLGIQKESTEKLAGIDEAVEVQQQQLGKLDSTYTHDVAKYNKDSSAIAVTADKDAKVVNQVNSWFGLGAISYGVHRFLSFAVWIFIGLLVLFVVLKFSSTLNPIAAVVFKGVESFAGLFLKTIVSVFKFIIPGALDVAGVVGKEVVTVATDVVIPHTSGSISPSPSGSFTNPPISGSL